MTVFKYINESIPKQNSIWISHLDFKYQKSRSHSLDSLQILNKPKLPYKPHLYKRIAYEHENPIPNQAENMIVAIPDPEEQERENDNGLAQTLNISSSDIVYILEECEQETETLALTQKVSQHGNNTYHSKQVIQK